MQMQKYVGVLERHVEWIAVGIGGLYLGWAVYAYVINPPLTVQLGAGTVATPATVDQKIYENTAVPLENQIKDNQVVSVTVKPVLSNYLAQLGETEVSTLALANAWGGVLYTPAADSSGPASNAPVITMAPDPLPGAIPKATSTGMTVVDAGNNNAGGVAPVPAPAGRAAVQPVALRSDVTYVSTLFTVDPVKLAAAFNASFDKPNVPPAFLDTMFVQVQLLREEQLGNGQWSAPTVVPSLPDPNLTPYPDAKATAQDYFAYRAMAEANQAALTTPTFLQTAADAPPWVFPGQQQPAGAQPAVAHAFDPARDVPKTPEERQIKALYDQQVEAQRRANASRGRTGRGGYGPGGFGPGGSSPYNYGPRGIAPYPPAYPRGTGAPTPNAAPNPGFPVNPLAGGPGASGRFNPNNTPEIELLAHDITVKEGKTYRYAIRYKLYNPVYSVGGQVVAPALLTQFAFSGPDPADPKNGALWTKPISIEPRTHLFVTNINAPQGHAKFDVFVWSNGRWHQSSTTRLAPGDPISGGKDAATDWTVVDVRSDPRTRAGYVIVMDQQGQLQRRDTESDQSNADYQRLKTEATAAAAAR